MINRSVGPAQSPAQSPEVKVHVMTTGFAARVQKHHRFPVPKLPQVMDESAKSNSMAMTKRKRLILGTYHTIHI